MHEDMFFFYNAIVLFFQDSCRGVDVEVDCVPGMLICRLRAFLSDNFHFFFERMLPQFVLRPRHVWVMLLSAVAAASTVAVFYYPGENFTRVYSLRRRCQKALEPEHVTLKFAPKKVPFHPFRPPPYNDG